MASDVEPPVVAFGDPEGEIVVRICVLTVEDSVVLGADKLANAVTLKRLHLLSIWRAVSLGEK